jgi:hypothetical protein
MAVLWIGFEEADQLRELLEGIAADERADDAARSRADAAAGLVGPRMDDDDLADLADLLAAAAAGEGLDQTWRDAARFWADQLAEWLKPPNGH